MASSNDLTAKEEKCIQARISGKSQRQSYKAAFNCKNMKDTTIDNKASKFFKRSEIRARFSEINEKHVEKAIYTKDEALKDIVKAIKVVTGELPRKTVIKELVDGVATTIVNRITLDSDIKALAPLIHQAAKLEGWEVDKVEHSGIINNNDISNMTEEELELEIKKQQEILKKV